MAIKWKFPARTATVHCSGGCRAKRDENGGLLCAYGCVTCGACVEACRFGAVQINDLGCAEVDEEKCIGCGACARKCPRGLIDLRRTEDRIAVLCSNRDKGFDPATKTGARTVCDVSCIGCGLCVKKCPADAIHVVEFRAVIDYERCLSCGACGDVCPRHAIRDRFGIITYNLLYPFLKKLLKNGCRASRPAPFFSIHIIAASSAAGTAARRQPGPRRRRPAPTTGGA